MGGLAVKIAAVSVGLRLANDSWRDGSEVGSMVGSPVGGK